MDVLCRMEPWVARDSPDPGHGVYAPRHVRPRFARGGYGAAVAWTDLGAATTNLRVENRFDPAVIQDLRNAGHDIEEIGAFDEVMGHAGALVRHPNGLIEGAADPRGDGAAAGA